LTFQPDAAGLAGWGGVMRSIVITGATRGLGRALALRYAREGIRLGLLGRDSQALDEAAEACRARGAIVETGLIDVRDCAALSDWMEAFDKTAPIDLLIVNAGVFSGHGRDQPESAQEIRDIISVNLDGAISTVGAALPMFRARKRGHLALIGSLAALYPLADAPAYSASKAGLMSYGEALREWLAADNIAVSLVYPGHIETAQVANHIGALPLLMSPEQAAGIIVRGLDRQRPVIAFPSRLVWLIRLSRIVPWRWRVRLGSGARFSVRK
jgi:short-subunit dehydrogenase